MKAMSFREGPDESARLTIRGLRGGYGDSQVLHGIDLQVRRGEVVTLLGRNGSGRTSTLRAIVGLL
ncbi:MAG TPA: ATP-binding cassette domain-containing protein, partial [Burkholderiaceae bacterium]|nr:ATP-binding cassette domain-containing protein [Burkholderiaceae bacterium]